jgi:hypothetical protein
MQPALPCPMKKKQLLQRKIYVGPNCGILELLEMTLFILFNIFWQVENSIILEKKY